MNESSATVLQYDGVLDRYMIELTDKRTKAPLTPMLLERGWCEPMVVAVPVQQQQQQSAAAAPAPIVQQQQERSCVDTTVQVDGLPTLLLPAPTDDYIDVEYLGSIGLLIISIW